MRFRLSSWCLLIALTGCSTSPEWVSFLNRESIGAARAGTYSFSWRLSGDRQVGPMQVFDDGRKTWLQFSPGQAVPAIFARTTHGDTPLNYHTDGPYAVVAKVWPVLVFRGGEFQARAERSSSVAGSADQDGTLVPSPPPLPSSMSGPTEVQPASVHGRTNESSATLDEPINDNPVATGITFDQEPRRTSPDPAHHNPQSSDTVGHAARSSGVSDINAVSSAFATAVQPLFEVSPGDHTMRQALTRWADIADWTFRPEHWAVDVDIPIVGEAGFETSFEHAVQQLLAATELADRPLQPCFYSNKVLRIIPYAQPCDRTAAPEPA